MAIIIRSVENSDANAIASLSDQLGYSISEEDTAAQISQINSSACDMAYVAVDADRVIGWIHIFYGLRLESSPFCEIGGLVVDESNRGKGIGKMLVEKAVDWSKTKNCKRVVVRSNAKRDDAHAFYTNLGFEERKLQKVFALKSFLK